MTIRKAFLYIIFSVNYFTYIAGTPTLSLNGSDLAIQISVNLQLRMPENIPVTVSEAIKNSNIDPETAPLVINKIKTLIEAQRLRHYKRVHPEQYNLLKEDFLGILPPILLATITYGINILSNFVASEYKSFARENGVTCVGDTCYKFIVSWKPISPQEESKIQEMLNDAAALNVTNDQIKILWFMFMLLTGISLPFIIPTLCNRLWPLEKHKKMLEYYDYALRELDKVSLSHFEHTILHEDKKLYAVN